MYKDETERHRDMQEDIDHDRDSMRVFEAGKFYRHLVGSAGFKPWREVDNRKAYMEKRMRMEGLE